MLWNRKKQPDGLLFDGDDALFKKEVSKASVYFEYGCGESTVWACGQVGAHVVSVDTSRDWIEKTRLKIDAIGSNGQKRDVIFKHIDVGAIGNWGRPLGFERRMFFRDYAECLWSLGLDPDVVLIDGRFRVCCFLTTLLNSQIGTKIFFDDYFDRPHYHIVEEFIIPIAMCGRQAMFQKVFLNDSIKKTIRNEIENFIYVVD